MGRVAGRDGGAENQQVTHVCGPHAWPRLTTLEPLEVEQLVEQAHAPLALLADQLQVLALLVDRQLFVQQQLGEPEDGCEQVLELVAELRQRLELGAGVVRRHAG